MVRSALALFAVSLGYGVVVPLVPTFAAGADGFLISLIYALYSAAKIGAQIPGGVWVDRAGARRVLLLGLALFAASTAGLLLPGPPAWLILLRILEGIGTGLVYPAVFARVFSAAGSRTGTSLGIVGGLGSSGMVVGPVLAGLLAPTDIRFPVAVALVVTVLAIVLVLIERAPPSEAAASAVPSRTVRDELRALIRVGSSVAFIGTVLPIGFNKLSYTGLQGVIPLHAEAVLHFSLQGITTLFAVLGVTFAVAQPVGGFLSDRFRARAVVFTLGPVALLSLGAMSLTENAIAYGVALFGYAFFSSVIFTVVLKHIADEFGGSGAHGGVYGVMGTLTDVMTVFGPLLFVNAYTLWPRDIYLVMAGTGAVFLGAFALLTSRKPTAVPPSG